VPSKRHSGNLWRSIEESGSPSRTWWRARRGIQPNWRGLGPQWNRDGDRKERAGRRRTEMMQRGPRMAPEKVRREGLRHLPPVSVLVLFSFSIDFISSVN